MINGIGKYLESGFYSNKGDIFDSAIEEYNETKDPESFNIITSLMVESGFRSENNCFIDLDKEFFDGDKLDRDKCDKFKKELVLYYSLDQLKYSFYGTQSVMTRITHDELKREGRNYKDYLPSSVTAKQEKEKVNKKNKYNQKLKNENKVPIYIYADATLSSTKDNKKTKTELNRLGNTGGSFDFAKGYDANHKVDKAWVAGFNREGTWELIELNNNKKEQSESLIQDSGNITTDVELLFDEDMLLLLDENNLLLDGVEEEYYSVTGELYAKREIDREKSINSIKNAINKSNVKSIKGIVLKDGTKETIQYYKDNFKEFISSETIFTTESNNKLSKTITEIKERDREEQLSINILNQLNSLKMENRSADEIVEALNPENDNCYITELNIFTNESDMALFLTTDNVKKLDKDIKEYIQVLDVPKESSKELSRSFQNIINNKNINEDTGLNTKTLLSKAYNRVVKKDDFKTEKILKTVTLSSILNSENLKAESITNKVDLNSTDDRAIWLKENIKTKYSAQLSNKVDSILSEIQITESENRGILNGFNNIEIIASSTGMTPIDLITYVLDDDKKEKKIHTENDLNSIIDETTKGKPKPFLLSSTKIKTNTDLDLTNSSDIIKFVNSSIVNNYDDDNSIKELTKYLKSKPVSINNSKKFSLDLINALNSRDRFPSGASSLLIARTVADSINGNNKDVTKLVEKSLKIYENDEIAEVKYNLLDDNDLKAFKFDPILSGFTPEESEDLITYLKTKPVSNRNSEEFSKGLLDSLKNPTSFPKNSRATDVATILAKSINGTNNIESLINSPTVSKLKLDDKTTLVNYINSNNIPDKKSKEFKELLIRGLDRDIKSSPIDIAKTISSVINGHEINKIPDSLKPVLTSKINFTRKPKSSCSIDRLKNDPVLTSYSDSDQSELFNFLSSNPVSKSSENRLNSSIINGLKIDSSQNPTQLAKRLSEVINSDTKDIPDDLKPLLTTSIQMNNINKQTVPLNYNFSDRGDINRLQFDPVLSNFNDSEQAELINYLKSEPVSVKSSPQFSSRLMSGLKSMPKTTRPISFASSLASSINRSNINRSNSTAKPTKSYNLLNKTGLSSFYKTKMFRDTGINKASFTNVVDSHRRNISNYSSNSSVKFPLSFKSVNSQNSNTSPIESTPNKPNNIYNQAYVVKKSNNMTKPLVRTINNSSKVKDVYKAFSRQSTTPTTNSSQIQTATINSGTQGARIGTSQAVNNPSYSSSSPVPTNTQQPKRPQPERQIKAPKPQLSPEEQKMERIQQNYINDKQAIGQGQKMLAKSKTKDVGSAGGSSTKNSTVGRSIAEASSSLLEEIKSKIDCG